MPLKRGELQGKSYQRLFHTKQLDTQLKLCFKDIRKANTVNTGAVMHLVRM